MKSIDRLAMELAGKSETFAELHLTRFGFSRAERAEIIRSHVRIPVMCFDSVSTIDPDWQAVAVTIKSTMECSVRIGDSTSEAGAYA